MKGPKHFAGLHQNPASLSLVQDDGCEKETLEEKKDNLRQDFLASMVISSPALTHHSKQKADVAVRKEEEQEEAEAEEEEVADSPARRRRRLIFQ